MFALLLAALGLGTRAVWTNALGAVDRWERLVTRVALLLDPPPDRQTRETVEATPRARSVATAASAAAAAATMPTAHASTSAAALEGRQMAVQACRDQRAASIGRTSTNLPACSG